MKLFLVVPFVAGSLALAAHAQTKIPASNTASKPAAAAPAPGGKFKFHFENAEIPAVVSAYSKMTGQKFVLDPSVRGKVNIMNPADVTAEEAFALLSSALATNSFAILEQGDTMVVMSARNAGRSSVPSVTELPPIKPERLVTMVFTLKHTTADEINKRLRILPSKDGEMTPFEPGNKLIVTDWVSNLHRIARIVAEVDQQTPARQ